jgi:phosphatidylinositol alpha-1,6-mannosyltransferase
LAAALLERESVTSVQNRPDRLLLLTELFPPAIGGSAVLFHGIYSRIPDAEVGVVTQGAPGAARQERQGSLALFHRAIATRRWGLGHPLALLHHLRLALHLRMLALRRRTVIHCGRALPEGVAAMLSRLSGGPRYVCWAHGEDLAMTQASREYSLVTKLVYRHAAAALANSRNTAQMLEQMGVSKDKIHIVYPAVDPERFHPGVEGAAVRRRYAGAEDVLLLSVGRLQRRKGHDVAILAMARLRDELPGLRYVIAGDGEERERLERLVDENGLRGRVFFAGAVPEAELPAHYAACDIFLLPNRVEGTDIEGFGIVFLEAAATGKPVIAGDSGGVPEAVDRNNTGLLVDGASVKEVARAIRHLAASADERARLGSAGRVRVRDHFSWQRAAAIVSGLQIHVASE